MSKEVDMVSVRDAFEILENTCVKASMGFLQLELLRTTVRTLRAEAEAMRRVVKEIHDSLQPSILCGDSDLPCETCIRQAQKAASEALARLNDRAKERP